LIPCPIHSAPGLQPLLTFTHRLMVAISALPILGTLAGIGIGSLAGPLY